MVYISKFRGKEILGIYY